jgi:hypothetical protein
MLVLTLNPNIGPSLLVVVAPQDFFLSPRISIHQLNDNQHQNFGKEGPL